MSIIQISKIQQRSGDLVDLPQLDEAEFGFASDEKRLFIGKTLGNIENIEVLTSYSAIAFDQIEGVSGNMNIDSASLANGQVMVYDGSNWVNGGGNASQPGNSSQYTGTAIHLGNISDVYIGGGAIGYVLTTDGSGGLNWSPKGIVSQSIETISDATTARITLSQPYPFAQGVEVTINGIGNSNYDVLNGNNYFLKTVPGNLQLYDLYSDSGLTANVSTSGYGNYPANTGTVIFNTVTSNGGLVAGTTYSVQYNSGSDFAGDSNFLYDYNNNHLSLSGTLAVTGNASVGNISGTNANFTGNATLGNVTTTRITAGASSTSGTITGNWSLTSGSRLIATYADLAEYYSADDLYEPGTVLEFGGDREVTKAGIESNKIAGIVSHEPAYVMNGNIQAEYPCMIALIGRVPIKVVGTVSKGDMLISAGNGYAKVSIITPKIGTVIGKAISNKFDDGEGFVEVMVGRL